MSMMEQYILARITVKEPVPEYADRLDPVSMQFNRAFQNFTWFLTGHGFKNADNIDACKRIRDLLTLTDTEVCLAGWNLSGANLKGADLSKADLSGADLTGANLTSTDLDNANLFRAKLMGASLMGASLMGTNLMRANLMRADLSGADLRCANMSSAFLDGAKYCEVIYNSTVFPADFAPEEHGMIEVSISGTPINP